MFNLSFNFRQFAVRIEYESDEKERKGIKTAKI